MDINSNGIEWRRLMGNSNNTQVVYFKGDKYYLWVINLGGQLKFNLKYVPVGVKADHRPILIRPDYVLYGDEKSEVYSEEVWKQINRDNKIESILPSE